MKELSKEELKHNAEVLEQVIQGINEQIKVLSDCDRNVEIMGKLTDKLSAQDDTEHRKAIYDAWNTAYRVRDEQARKLGAIISQTLAMPKFTDQMMSTLCDYSYMTLRELASIISTGTSYVKQELEEELRWREAYSEEIADEQAQS